MLPNQQPTHLQLTIYFHPFSIRHLQTVKHFTLTFLCFHVETNKRERIVLIGIIKRQRNNILFDFQFIKCQQSKPHKGHQCCNNKLYMEFTHSGIIASINLSSNFDIIYLLLFVCVTHQTQNVFANELLDLMTITRNNNKKTI